jgi:hypothetical protein
MKKNKKEGFNGKFFNKWFWRTQWKENLQTIRSAISGYPKK